jgi:hypothetical protein
MCFPYDIYQVKRIRLIVLNNFFQRLPLPKEVPMSFRVLPEYIIEDIVDYYYFAVQYVLTTLAAFTVDDLLTDLRI